MLSHSTAGALFAALLGLALALSPGTAGAQQPSPSAKQPSPSAMANATELATLKGVKSMFEPMVVGMVEKAKGMFLQTNPMLGKDLNEVAAKLRLDYVPRSAEAVAETARLYATRFSEQELKDAIAFYKSPLGHKLLTEEPLIADQSLRFATGWADKLSEEIVGKMRTEMKKRGHDI
jgi:uncharacterized protein